MHIVISYTYFRMMHPCIHVQRQNSYEKFAINAYNCRIIKIDLRSILHVARAGIKLHLASAIPKIKKKSWWSCKIHHSQSCLTEIWQKLFCILSAYVALINESYFQITPIKNCHKITMQLKVSNLTFFHGFRLLVMF